MEGNIDIPSRLLNPKYKDRTAEIHEKHIIEGNKNKHATTLVIGSSLIERFETTGREHLRDFKYNGVILAGVGGDCVQHVWWRLKDGKLLERLTSPINHVILMIGTNNIPDEKNIEKLAASVSEMYKFLKTKVPHVTVLELPPKAEPEMPKYDIVAMLKTYNETLGKLIPEEDLVKDWWLGLSDANGQLIKEMYDDNVHFSSEGYKIVAKTLLDLIK